MFTCHRCSFSRHFYWQEIVDQNQDLDMLQRRTYLDMPCCCWMGKRGCYWVEQTSPYMARALIFLLGSVLTRVHHRFTPRELIVTKSKLIWIHVPKNCRPVSIIFTNENRLIGKINHSSIKKEWKVIKDLVCGGGSHRFNRLITKVIWRSTPTFQFLLFHFGKV